MKKICEQCKGEYEAKRETSRFCSAKCRKLAFLSVPKVTVPRNGKNANSVTDKVVTDKPKFNEITVSLEEVCTPEEIQKFPNMCETKKLQKEAIYRLEHNDIEKLRKAGISIPVRYG